MGYFASHYKSKLSYAWDADFLAFWERTTGTPDNWKLSYNQLFLDLKAANVFSKLDIMYMYAANNETDARINLIQNAYNATAYNSPMFTSKVGFTGNGSSSYLRTHFIPNIGTNKYSINNACCYVFVESSVAGYYIFGMYGGGSGWTIIPQGGGDEACINSAMGTIGIVGDYVGLTGLSRSANNIVRNRASGYFTNNTTNSVGLPTIEFYDLCLNINGSASLFSGNTHSSIIIGASLSDSEAIALEVAIIDFKTAIASL